MKNKPVFCSTVAPTTWGSDINERTDDSEKERTEVPHASLENRCTG